MAGIRTSYLVIDSPSTYPLDHNTSRMVIALIDVHDCSEYDMIFEWFERIKLQVLYVIESLETQVSEIMQKNNI